VPSEQYDQTERKILLDLARRSIECGLSKGTPVAVAVEDYSAALNQDRACFVTLLRNDQLRGCIGGIESLRPLVIDVADRAFVAANRDPRFPPLQAHELESTEIEISILLPLEPLNVQSEQALLNQLRPGVDGLVLEDGAARGVFLPAVWEKLPGPLDFVTQLRKKAGLPESHWTNSERYWTFRTETFGDR
jgi:AmmeMemoRadiSam system protein A